MTVPTGLLGDHAAREWTDAAPARPGRLDDRLFMACGLVWGAGLIHVAAAVEHYHEYRLYALFFALLAPLQFVWGLVVCRRPSRRLVLAGAVGCLLVVGLWVMSRTTGMPIGPEPWRPEAVGVIDAIATADELTLALLAFTYLRPARRPRLGAALRGLAMSVGFVMVVLSSLALMAAPHAG